MTYPSVDSRQPSKPILSKMLKAGVIVLLILGIFFRWINLDRKAYWGDEVVTSMRVAGYDQDDIADEIFDGRIVRVQDLQKYKYPNPERNLGDAIAALAAHPEHPPLYYVALRFWAQLGSLWFGDSILWLRSLSVLISLFVFPCLYWLCLELFASAWVGWVAIALASVAPIHILYAQEAREYSLWAVTTLLSSAALLRATRLQTKASWRWFTGSLILGFYSHILFVLVAIGQGLYLAVTERLRWNKATRRWRRSLLIALGAYLPWIGVTVLNMKQVTDVVDSVQKDVAPFYIIYTWFRNLNRAFFSIDFGEGIDDWSLIDRSFRNFFNAQFDIELGFTQLLLPLLVLIAIYWLWRRAPQPGQRFIFVILAATALPLMLSDLVVGGTISNRIRYLIPAYLCLQMALAYLFTTQIAHSKILGRSLWSAVLLLVLGLGIGGSYEDTNRNITWSKDSKTASYLEIAETVNGHPDALILSDTLPVRVLTLSYRLDPNIRFELLQSPDTVTVPQRFNPVYLFDPSEELRQQVERLPNRQLVQREEGDRLDLWELVSTRSPSGPEN